MTAPSRLMAFGGLALIAGTVLGLGACTNGSGVHTVKGDDYAYHQDYLRYAASRGPVQTVVRGNAFGAGADGEFAGRVIGEMQDRPLGVGKVEFEPAEPAGLKGPVYVSMVFNPEPGFDSYDACAPERVDAAGGSAKAGQPARVVAAFCSTERLLSGTVGEATINGPDDPRFGELIRFVMLDLFPPRNPNLGPSCDSCP